MTVRPARFGPLSGRPLIVQPDEAEKFWARVGKGDGCWLWQGPIGPGGYGAMGLRCGDGPYAAHRIAFVTTKGPIPTGLCVMHTCDVRPCVNPDHLILGTHRDNMADAAQKGRMGGGSLPVTHCKRGHLRLGANVSGWGACVPCRAAYDAERRRHHLAEWQAIEHARLAPHLPENERALLDKMPFRHAAILKSWYGLYGAECLDLSAIATILGVSRQRVEQLRNRALQLLGVELGNAKPKDDAEQLAQMEQAS